MKKIIAYVALVLLSLTGIANATPIEPSYTVRQITDLKKQAGHNDTAAQKQLGYLYLKGFLQGGHLIKPDNVEALKYFREAADSGDALAQTYVGWFYDTGIVVDQNYKTALKWYRLAEKQGNPAAQDLIGRQYRDGHGVAQDYSLAADYFKKATLQFYGNSHLHLGRLYATGGPGWPQDYEKAFFWMSLPKNPAWAPIMKALSPASPLCCEDDDFTSLHHHPHGSYVEVKAHLTPKKIKEIEGQVNAYKMPAPTKWSPESLKQSALPQANQSK